MIEITFVTLHLTEYNAETHVNVEHVSAVEALAYGGSQIYLSSGEQLLVKESPLKVFQKMREIVYAQ